MALQEGFQLLGRSSPGEGDSAGTHPEAEEVGYYRGTIDLNDGLAPVHLGLLPIGSRQGDEHFMVLAGKAGDEATHRGLSTLELILTMEPNEDPLGRVALLDGSLPVSYTHLRAHETRH